MNWAIHPLIYQVTHPWHWLTYGQNGVAVGLVLTVGVNLFTVYVLYRTLLVVERQAAAAETQARAAQSAADLATSQLEQALEAVRTRDLMRAADVSIFDALADPERWEGSRPRTAGGDVAVRADELAEALSLSPEIVVRRLLKLQRRGRVQSIGGTLEDSTARWVITRN